METRKKYRILIWTIVVLVVLNLSMILSFAYHRHQEMNPVERVTEENSEVPARQRTRYFREQLNLDNSQVEKFRELNRNFNQSAWQIRHRLSALRLAMVNEMNQNPADKQELQAIASEIGNLHTRLKSETIEYYIAMKEVCTEEQQKKLHEIFVSILEKNDEVNLPQGGGRFRNNRQN